MKPISIDLILHCQWVLPIVPNDQILHNHSVAIDNGRILEILPTTDAKKKYNGIQSEALNQHILMPGLINSHCHSSSRLLRGLKSDFEPLDWVETHIYNAETVFSDPKFITDSVNLAIAEMIKTGTTCFADMHSPAELFVDIAQKTGIRSQINFTLKEKPSIFGKDAEDCLHKGLKLRDNQSSHPLTKVACGLSNLSDIEDKTLERLAAYVNELDLPIQILCNETKKEIETSLNKFGCRPLQRLDDMGLLLPETQLIGVNNLNSEDCNLLEKTNSQVVVIPKNNQLNSNQTGTVNQLLTQATNLSIGTAGVASSNNLNLMASAQALAGTINSCHEHNSEQAAHKALRMATINGAKTLGLDNQIGSIENGKYADLIALEIDSIHHQPLYNLISQLVYNSASNHVTHSWVAGQPLLKNADFCTIDEKSLIQSAKDWGKTLINV